jgi:hypothetical protein
MPRYLVERSFIDGLHIPMDAIGAKTCAEVVATNLDYGVTWAHSYVTPDKTKTYCIYDAPSPEAIRQSATRAGFRSTGSPRSRSWTPTSTPGAGERALDAAGPHWQRVATQLPGRQRALPAAGRRLSPRISAAPARRQ